VLISTKSYFACLTEPHKLTTLRGIPLPEWRSQPGSLRAGKRSSQQRAAGAREGIKHDASSWGEGFHQRPEDADGFLGWMRDVAAVFPRLHIGQGSLGPFGVALGQEVCLLVPGFKKVYARGIGFRPDQVADRLEPADLRLEERQNRGGEALAPRF
jgi:hypothetical protein